MKHRKLRIAWSVTWGVVAVLLCVLWVRSYRLNDYLYRLDQFNQITTLRSYSGDLYFERMIALPLIQDGPPRPPPSPHGWKYDSVVALKDNVPRSFKFVKVPSGFRVYLPFWLFVAASATLGAIPWLRFRFSLRTLLIATTVVAIALGVIVWAMKS